MSEKQDFFMEFLREEGYRPQLDEDGDILFKHEGQSYLLFVENSDPGYFRLVYPAFWEISTPDEEEKSSQFIMDINAEMKVVKLYQLADKLWAAVEMFCDPIENSKSVFQRCLRVLQLASNRFMDKMRESLGLPGRPTEQGFHNPTDWMENEEEGGEEES
ncbi:MAG: T3SS (YopN, CesT) and YbjN peptide-binding chaperone 1 [Gemmataceae bacterium]|jgi:hypothetical protein